MSSQAAAAGRCSEMALCVHALCPNTTCRLRLVVVS